MPPIHVGHWVFLNTFHSSFAFVFRDICTKRSVFSLRPGPVTFLWRQWPLWISFPIWKVFFCPSLSLSVALLFVQWRRWAEGLCVRKTIQNCGVCKLCSTALHASIQQWAVSAIRIVLTGVVTTYLNKKAVSQFSLLDAAFQPPRQLHSCL